MKENESLFVFFRIMQNMNHSLLNEASGLQDDMQISQMWADAGLRPYNPVFAETLTG